MDKRKPMMTRKTQAAHEEYEDAPAREKRAMKREAKEPTLRCPKCERMLVDNDENRAYVASKA